MATHSHILAWRIPSPEEPGRLESMGVTKSHTQLSDLHTHRIIHMYTHRIFFIHLYIDEHFSCLYILAILNNAAQLSFSDIITDGHILAFGSRIQAQLLKDFVFLQYFFYLQWFCLLLFSFLLYYWPFISTSYQSRYSQILL